MGSDSTGFRWLKRMDKYLRFEYLTKHGGGNNNMQQATTNRNANEKYIPAFKGRELGVNLVTPRELGSEFVTLSWANGLRAKKRSHLQKGQTGEYKYAGLFCNTKEDEQLDQAMTDVKAERIEIWHSTAGQWGEHWALPRVALFLLAEWLGSKGSWENWGERERQGLVYGWKYDAKKKRDASYFRLQVVLRPLLKRGYAKPLVLAMGNTSTDYAWNLLYWQRQVLAFAHQAMGDDDQALTLWSYALPVGASVEPTTRNQQEIYPIQVLPVPLDIVYLQRYEVKPQEIEVLSRLSRESVQWSRETYQRILEPTAAPA